MDTKLNISQNEIIFPIHQETRPTSKAETKKPLIKRKNLITEDLEINQEVINFRTSPEYSNYT